MESTYPTLNEVLDRLAELQRDTRPIDLTLGMVDQNNVVKSNYVVLHDAPPAVVKAVVNEFAFVSLTYQGLIIQTAA